VPSKKKQRIVASHDSDERYRQRCGILRDSTMDQETACQQGKVFRHWQAQSTQQQDQKQSGVSKMLDIGGDESCQN